MTTSHAGITGGLSLKSLVSEFEDVDDLIETCRLFISPICSATYDPETNNNQVFLDPVLPYSGRLPHQDQSQQTSQIISSPRVYLDLDSHRNLTSSTPHSPNFSQQDLQNPLFFSCAKKPGPIQTVLSPTTHAEHHLPSKRKRVARRALFKPVSERGYRKLCSHGFPSSLQSSEGSVPRVEASPKRTVESVKDSCSSAKAPLKSSENIKRRPKGPPTCMLCGKQFEDTRGLARHITDHSRKVKSGDKKRQPLAMKFVCGMCTPKKFFDSAAKLQNHLKTFHSNTKVGCARCRQSVESANSLRDHVSHCHGAPSGASSGTVSEVLVPGPHRIGNFALNRDGGIALEGSDFCIPQTPNRNDRKAFERLDLCVPQSDCLYACSLCDETFLDGGMLVRHELLDHRVPTPESSLSHPGTPPNLRDSRQHDDLLRVKQNFALCMNVSAHSARNGFKPMQFSRALSNDGRIKLNGNSREALVSVPVGHVLSPAFREKKGLVVLDGRKTLVLSLQKITKIRGFETRIFDKFSMDVISKDGFALFSTSAKIPQRLEEFLVFLEEASELDVLPEVPSWYKVHSSKKTKQLNFQPVDNAGRPTMANVGENDELLTNKSFVVRSTGFGVAQRTEQNTCKQQISQLFPRKDGTFPCELCWKVFWTKGSLKNHLSRKH